jgi:hypothetical protein
MYMTDIVLTHPADSGDNSPMPRRKVFQRNINLPITDAQLARIEAVLHKDTGEVRVGFIRTAIERELERREREKQKPGRK